MKSYKEFVKEKRLYSINKKYPLNNKVKYGFGYIPNKIIRDINSFIINNMKEERANLNDYKFLNTRYI